MKHLEHRTNNSGIIFLLQAQQQSRKPLSLQNISITPIVCVFQSITLLHSSTGQVDFEFTT